MSRSSKQSSNFSRITYPCRLYCNTHTVYTRIYFCILLFLQSTVARRESNPRAKPACTNKSGSLSNDKCFRSAVVIRGIALLQSNSYNTLIHLCQDPSCVFRSLAEWRGWKGVGRNQTRPNKPRPMDLRSFGFPGIQGGNEASTIPPHSRFSPGRILERRRLDDNAKRVLFLSSLDAFLADWNRFLGSSFLNGNRRYDYFWRNWRAIFLLEWAKLWVRFSHLPCTWWDSF